MENFWYSIFMFILNWYIIMRIVIDGRPFVKRPTGIGTFTIDAIKSFCDYLPNWEIVLALPDELHPEVDDLPLDKITLVIEKLPFKAKRFLWMQLKLPFIARKYKADILWSTNSYLPLLRFKSYKTMITIHDVVWKEYNKTMEHRIISFFTSWFIDNTIKNADYIWYNSFYTKRSVEKYYPTLVNKTTVVGDSCNSRFKKINVAYQTRLDIYKRYNIQTGYILFVGSLEPRKNLSFLIRLMPEIYRRTSLKLLVVGAKGWKNNEISNIINSPSFNKSSVVFAGYVNNELLVKLYNTAHCYISTAINEGFGMPQLEAMACGCPVITANNSAMTEVAKGRGILVDGWDEQTWINIICNTVTNNELLESMRNPDISEYSWKQIIMNVDKYLRS